jgi:hypothetical protein
MAILFARYKLSILADGVSKKVLRMLRGKTCLYISRGNDNNLMVYQSGFQLFQFKGQRFDLQTSSQFITRCFGGKFGRSE